MRGILGYFYPSLHIIITWIKRGFVAAKRLPLLCSRRLSIVVQTLVVLPLYSFRFSLSLGKNLYRGDVVEDRGR